MRKSNNRTVILSAYSKFLTDDINLENHYDLISTLKAVRMPHKPVIGEFEGDRELSVIVEIFNDSDLATCQSLAKHYKQDCIMVINKDNSCYLLNGLGVKYPMGIFQEVTYQVAERSGNYTYDYNNEIYYKAV